MFSVQFGIVVCLQTMLPQKLNAIGEQKQTQINRYSLIRFWRRLSSHLDDRQCRVVSGGVGRCEPQSTLLAVSVGPVRWKRQNPLCWMRATRHAWWRRIRFDWNQTRCNDANNRCRKRPMQFYLTAPIELWWSKTSMNKKMFLILNKTAKFYCVGLSC